MPPGVEYPEGLHEAVPGEDFVVEGGGLVDTDGDGQFDQDVGGFRKGLGRPDPVLEYIVAQRAAEEQAAQEALAGGVKQVAQNPLAGLAGAVGKVGQGVQAAGQGLANAAQVTGRANYGTERGIAAENAYAQDQARQAIDATVAADRAEAAAEAAAVVRKKAELEAHEGRVRSLTAERDRVVGDQIAKVQRLSDEARAQKINPKELWQNAGGLQKVSMVLGVALGGLLLPTLGKNPALDIINREVELNIDAQKANLANLRDGVQDERSILADLRAQFGDQATAELALHGIMLDQVANDFDGKLAGVKDQRALARGLELSAKLHAEAAEKQAQAQERARVAAQQAWENRFHNRQLGEQVRSNKAGEYIAGRKLTLEERQLELSGQQAAAKAKSEADGKSRWFRGVTGGEGDGHALRIESDAERKDYAGSVGGAEGVLDAVATIRDAMDREGRTEFNDASKLIVRSAQATALLAASERVKGNPSDKDMKIVMDKAGGGSDPTTWDFREGWGRLSIDERKKVLEYVTRDTVDSTDRIVKSYSGGKAAFNYKGTSLLGAEPDVRGPSFADARKAFLKGETGPQIFLGKRASDSIAVNPTNRNAVLGAIAERISGLDRQLKDRRDLSPESKAQIRRERQELGRVVQELKKRAKDAEEKPTEFKRTGATGRSPY
jgi:hypothetical protein